ncbi:inactive peptidyl-prolyl cis-trans isomerase FKBP6-like protein [Dinothrombium tinctorium]|uniref:peptidylprolyl isomerase n=1 Tax=Dinothrombium tinctorium TaxID=1965070 RepID=A0A3S3PE47_9ACAR|nr:inactive peptidyl-prolyl cis-trans isomerase FKBP6-like protein [Dinothrombium tinctorium]RWS08880.1 inactive peptidyl-prolyl cis-trans isomerase FKBP6-like protein [Dinothrombium tinctorium]
MDGYEEYETVDACCLPESANGVTLNELENGVVVDSDQHYDNDDFDINDISLWWSKNAILNHIDDESSDLTNFQEDRDLPFDELIKKMDALTDDGGVYKRTLRYGSGECVGNEDALVYHCEAYLEGADEPFDSSVLRNRPYLHRLCENDGTSAILPGLLIALKTMKSGEIAQVIVCPEHAFQEYGCPPRVPADATILYRIQIVKILEKGSIAMYDILSEEEKYDFSFDEIFKMTNQERIMGNTFFQDQKYPQAIFRYRKAINVLERRVYKNDDEARASNDLLLKLYCNAANAYNKVQKHHAAICMSKRALNINPTHLKAMYQYAKSKRLNGDYGTAKEMLLEAKALKPNDASIINELRKLDEIIRKESMDEKELLKKMIGGIIK